MNTGVSKCHKSSRSLRMSIELIAVLDLQHYLLNNVIHRFCPYRTSKHPLKRREEYRYLLSWMQENNIKFLMPCKNTNNAVAILLEFAQEKRGKISVNVIENN